MGIWAPHPLGPKEIDGMLVHPGKASMLLVDGIFPSVFSLTSPYRWKWDIFRPWSKMKIQQNCKTVL